MTTATGHTTAIQTKKVIGTNVKDLSGEKIGRTSAWGPGTISLALPVVGSAT